ncbi:MAG TPA: rhodanese, partial [Rhodocyclaceae bacterium]|nr:rhodanese [Rhodocyclaceae bacterium]
MKLQTSTLARLEPVNSLSAERLAELARICSAESFDLGADPLRGMTTQGQSVYLVQGELKLDFAEGGMRLMVG